MSADEEAIYFTGPEELRGWLEAHGEAASALVIGFYKKGSGTPGVTYAEALDEALCLGWIDGVRRRVDDARFTIRFTPRKPGSIWSAVNIARVEELTRLGRMRPAGLAAFARRAEGRSRVYSYEQTAPDAHTLAPAYAQRFQAAAAAWAYFTAQAPSYQRTAIWWVMGAKREETRERRLATLIADSASGRRLAHLTYGAKG